MLWNYKCLCNPKFNWMRIFVEKDWLCSFTLSHYCVFKGDWQQLFILYGFRLSTCSVTPPGSLVQGILQARMLEWFAISSSRVSSWPRDWTPVSYVSRIAGWFFTNELSGKLTCLVWFVYLFCFLDSIYKWNHRVFVFLCLTYYTNLL